MFEEDTDGKIKAMHHPFTAPDTDDIEKIINKPESLLSKSYDIVLNGNEIGGGSIRIHDKKVQEAIFKVLGISDEDIKDKFGFLINAFLYGVPPHGGFAFGFDRLCALMTGDTSIREVIAFPKNQKAICPLTGTPTIVSEESLKELGL
jgi:aspartyl-tRNA synthetase